MLRAREDKEKAIAALKSFMLDYEERVKAWGDAGVKPNQTACYLAARAITDPKEP